MDVMTTHRPTDRTRMNDRSRRRLIVLPLAVATAAAFASPALAGTDGDDGAVPPPTPPVVQPVAPPAVTPAPAAPAPAAPAPAAPPVAAAPAPAAPSTP